MRARPPDPHVRQAVRQVAEGLARVHHDRVVVGRFHALDHRQLDAHARARVLPRAREALDHLGRAHRLAVVPARAGAQREHPGAVVRGLPARREAGPQHQVGARSTIDS
jgi:hypothetical protein